MKKDNQELLDFYVKSLQTDDGKFLTEADPTVMTAYFSILAFRMVYGLLKDAFSKANKECSGFAGAAKNLCILKYKIDATEKSINILRSKMAECHKAKDVAKCHEKFERKIDDLEKRLERMKEQQKIYMQKQNEEKSTEMKQIRV